MFGNKLRNYHRKGDLETKKIGNIRNKNHLKFRKILETDPTTYVDLSLFLMGRDCVPMLTFDLNNTCAQPVINKLRAIFVQIKSQPSIITFFKIYIDMIM